MIRKVDTAEDALATYDRFRTQILEVISLAGDITERDLLGLLDDRQAVMFTDDTSIAVAQIITHEDEVVCLVRIATGDLNAIISGYDFVSEWSQKHGAIGMCLVGRRGWLRSLKNLGFSEIRINTNKNNEKAGQYLLGKYYGFSTKNNNTNDPD